MLLTNVKAPGPLVFNPGHIQNGRLSAIITFNMLDIWQTVPDS